MIDTTNHKPVKEDYDINHLTLVDLLFKILAVLIARS